MMPDSTATKDSLDCELIVFRNQEYNVRELEDLNNPDKEDDSTREDSDDEWNGIKNKDEDKQNSIKDCIGDRDKQYNERL